MYININVHKLTKKIIMNILRNHVFISQTFLLHFGKVEASHVLVEDLVDQVLRVHGDRCNRLVTPQEGSSHVVVVLGVAEEDLP